MKTILSIIAAISFILMMGEAETGFMQILWTGGCMATFGIAATILGKMEDQKGEEEQ